MAWLILMAIIAVPVVEIALFIKSAHWLGVLPTILLALTAGAVGIWLIRIQGLAILLRARNQMDRGEVPVQEVFDGICLAAAGLLLMLPGFFTDMVAVILLLPPVRAALRHWLMGRMTAVTVAGQSPPPGQPPVIDAEYHVVDDKDAPKS